MIFDYTYLRNTNYLKVEGVSEEELIVNRRLRFLNADIIIA
jgi:hypothetical protein